jgi:signal recognition particle subunit SRP54
MPQLPPGLDPSQMPGGGFKPPKLDFNKLGKKQK